MPMKNVSVYIQLAWKFWLIEFHARAVFVKQALCLCHSCSKRLLPALNVSKWNDRKVVLISFYRWGRGMLRLCTTSPVAPLVSLT